MNYQTLPASSPLLYDPGDPPRASLTSEPEPSPELLAILKEVHAELNQWETFLQVGIGRARELSTLKESQIRYFEALGALPSVKPLHAGASRTYTLSNLRRLCVLSRLMKQEGLRPSEAAEMVRNHAQFIDRGMPWLLPEVLDQEGNVIHNGFLLARLMSQVMDATQCELGDPTTGGRVIGLIVPMQDIFQDYPDIPPDVVQQMGRTLEISDMPLALMRDKVVAPEMPAPKIPPVLLSSGRDDTTVLFYSREPWPLPHRDTSHYSAYRPAEMPHLTMLVMMEAAPGMDRPHLLHPIPERTRFLNTMLQMIAEVFSDFRQSTSRHQAGYRYRSDGFPLVQTRATFYRLLEKVRSLVFPGLADDSMVALFIPNTLERPTALAMLAYCGYEDELASRIHLSLYRSGDEVRGEGLTGLAYALREPFLTLDATHDPRVAYREEEQARVALAVPLLAPWGGNPFGVLFLASRHAAATLHGDQAYVAITLGSILSELLGRWWLTRLRKEHEQLLHRQMAPMIRWLNRMDRRGVEFQHALDALEHLWNEICRRMETGASPPMEGDCLALAILDIDAYQQEVQQAERHEPFAMKAQLHVEKAIARVLPRTQGYWFKHDHALFWWSEQRPDQAVSRVQQIANQIGNWPVEIQKIQHGKERNLYISVSAAIKVLTYDDLFYLGRDTVSSFRAGMEEMIEDMRKQAGQSSHPNTLYFFTTGGWVEQALNSTQVGLSPAGNP
ncbi:MAG: MerR family transcriptional regulator [Chloroflexaceae bacterium]|nr:MerR family transcriptional regulator [Chloroflexaceae bacterium]